MTKSSEEDTPTGDNVIADRREKTRIVIEAAVKERAEGWDLSLSTDLVTLIAEFCPISFDYQYIFQAARSGKNAEEIVTEILQGNGSLESEAIGDFLQGKPELMQELEIEQKYKNVINNWFPYNEGRSISFIPFIEFLSVVDLVGQGIDNIPEDRAFTPLFMPAAIVYIVYMLLGIVSLVLALVEAILIAPPVRLSLVMKHSIFSNASKKYNLDDKFTISDATNIVNGMSEEIEYKQQHL